MPPKKKRKNEFIKAEWKHYFGKAFTSIDIEDMEEDEHQSSTAGPRTYLDIGMKRKRPIGRPRKPKAPATPSKSLKLVDYSSSSDSDCGGEQRQSDTTSSSPHPIKSLRRNYSITQKRTVANYAKYHGIRSASNHYKISHSNVIRWKKQELTRIKNPNERKYARGQGRHLSYSKELEEKLCIWILEKRENECVAISTKMIRFKAMPMIKQVNPSFKASDGWVRKFMKRNNFVLGAKTHISQNLPKDLECKISAFREEMNSVQENSDYPYDFICNMDEIPVFLDLLPSKVVDKKGEKSVTVRTTASEKNRVTAVLCCSASGKMLAPLVIFKGKTQIPLKNVSVPDRVFCTTQVKAWMDEKVMLEWIEKIWKPFISGKPALLSLDTFSAHLTDAVRDAFSKCHTKLIVIPGGCTSVLQPLDVSINKPFKSYIRRMVTEAEKNLPAVKAAPKTTLLEWVKRAVELIENKPTIVQKSFQVTGIVGPSNNFRNDTVYIDIQDTMNNVFGEVHMGYVENKSDPFAHCDDSDNVASDTPSLTCDPFAEDCEESEPETSAIVN